MPNYRQAAQEQQAHFRQSSRTIYSPAGYSDGGKLHCYVLAEDHERENLYPTLRDEDGAIKFFRDRVVKWHGGAAKSKSGPTRNMTDSQIMCVNFLLPLAGVVGALAAVVHAIDSDVKSIRDICYEGNVSPVEFEWIGVPRSLESKTTRGARTTSVDAFVIADVGTGLRAYLIEWKYAEQYLTTKPKPKDESSRRSQRQLDRYRDLYYAESSSFSGSVPMEELLYEPFDQIMRLRLLADRMVRCRELGVTDAKVVVVVPEENADYRKISCRKKVSSPLLIERFPDKEYVEDTMRATLKRPDDAFAMVCPSTLVDTVERECSDSASDWVAYMRERYAL